MESDENYQDLIKQYQILLENEKRRLTPVNFNSTEIDEKYVPEAVESPALQDEGHKIADDNEPPEPPDSEISKTVVNQKSFMRDIPSDIPKETKHDIQKRAKMMEQWVTDSFYTSFPSFKKQDLSKNALADDRREDYRKYLAEISNKKLLDVVKGGRRTEEHLDSANICTDKQKFSARDKLLDDLKHSDLAYNFHNPEAIQDRNEKIAIERTRRKVELQQELMRQMEEKKLEIERLRAKEKKEDELLQRRVENQMKALQMTDELTKKITEKVRITNPVNQTTRNRDQIRRRDLENNIDTNKSEDGSPESRIKNDANANHDRQIYKFFSNSAPHNDSHVNYYTHPVGFSDVSTKEHQLQHISTAIHNPVEHCYRCRRPVPVLCSSCCHNAFNPSHLCCYRCNLLQNMDVCNNCRRGVQSWNLNGDLERCGVNIHQRDNRPQILEITYQDHSSQTTQASTSPVKRDRIKATRSESPENGKSFGHKTQNESHSPMRHADTISGMETILSDVPEAVSLSKEDELLELKRKNDILIAKYARNYGSLRNRKSVSKEKNSRINDDSFPLPLMREHFTTTSSKGADMDKAQPHSQAIRKLEYKWEIPVVQKQVITNKPAKVLTQCGAIAKQLQLEKLNFGND